MMDRNLGISGWIRALRAAARLVLCLGLVLLPVAAVSAAHFDAAAAAGPAHGHGSDPAPSPDDVHAPLCHQAGACYAFVAPAAPRLARARAAAMPEIPALHVPASAAVHRLFRPPIAADRA